MDGCPLRNGREEKEEEEKGLFAASYHITSYFRHIYDYEGLNSGYMVEPQCVFLRTGMYGAYCSVSAVHKTKKVLCTFSFFPRKH